jgi:opacity protein-like surface antigen
MTFTTKAATTLIGLASATLAVASSLTPVSAADLGGPRGGSIKDDGYAAPAPSYSAPRGPSGPCYFRTDVGYSWSRNPSLSWPVSNDVTDLTNPAAPVYSSTYVGDTITNTSMANTWFGDVGLGCSMGSYGIRGEVMLGYHGNRKIDGKPLDYTRTVIDPVAPPVTPVPFDDPVHASLKSYTLMFNGYKDLGNFNGVVPYVGAGVGMAYNKMSEVYFTDNPLLVNRIEGDSKLSLAWSLMAGIGWQVSDRTILDLGYRYMDFGKAQSGRVDSAGFVNPALQLTHASAHEVKIGLRYHFGASGNDCCSAQPMK